jgi:hypothetical protein
MLILSATIVATNTSAQYQRRSEEAPPARRQPEEVYHESALRRFEIVTLVSLPFTAIHSFLAVRGVQMIRQSEFAPELSGTDFRIIGASAVSLALFIGFWDWLHTHNKGPSQQLIPDSPKLPPRTLPRLPPREAQDDWKPDETEGLVVSFVHVRF